MIEQDTFGFNFNMNPMTNDISTGLHKDQNVFQPTKMLSGLSSFRNWPDFNNSVMFPSNKPENGLANDKLSKLEEENMMLEQRITSLTQENANINKQWEFERDLMKDQIFNHKQTITQLTNIINQHLQREIDNRDMLINSISRLKEDSVGTVRSQAMSKVSDLNDTGSLDISRNSSNKVSKSSRNNSSRSAFDENRGAKASRIFAEIVKQQQHSQVDTQSQVPLTINKKILVKHTEDIRSQSLPYNLDCLVTKPLENANAYVRLNGPAKPDFMEDENQQYGPSQTGVHISDVENSSNLGSLSHNAVLDNNMKITTNQLINSSLESQHIPSNDAETKQTNNQVSINEENIPVYDFFKCPKKVVDLWNEFTISTPEKPSILSMNEKYGSAWRKLSPALDKQYSRRHMVYRAIKYGVDYKNFTVDQCVEILEQARIRYYDSATAKEISLEHVTAEDLESGKTIQKQKSIGWLTNCANIPNILKN